MDINPLYPALISGFIGAIIGGFITLIATLMNQRHQQKLQQQKLDHERKTILASQRFKFLVDLYNIVLEQSHQVLSQLMYDDFIHLTTDSLTLKINKIKSLAIATNDPQLKELSDKLMPLSSHDITLRDDISTNTVNIMLLQHRFSVLMGEVSEATFDTSYAEK